jgi:hypothetical protein
LGVGKAGGPVGQVFKGQVERMENGAAHGRYFGVGSAQPWLDGRHNNRRIAHRKLLGFSMD